MTPEQVEQRWGELSRQAILGMADWRAQHAHASLSEIEQAVDERLGELRARMVEDAAQASPLAQVQQAPPGQRGRSPQCGGPLQARGQETRTLQTHQQRLLHLERSYAVCTQCGAGVFPPG